MNLQIADIGHVIQLAIAPVFLLASIGTLLLVLTNRLARTIDRTRVLEERILGGAAQECREEVHILYRRSIIVNHAIWLCTICGLLVCAVIAMLFLGDTNSLPLDRIIAACFVFAMLSLMGVFFYLLREILLACRFMRAQQLKALARQ
jgi:peptidoglycan/LPS O-acetylase OafA/YrhL